MAMLGSPAVLILIWTIIRSVYFVQNRETEGGGVLYCSWMTDHPSDWIYQVPALLVLAVNFLFLVRIMWVLIMKLRSATNVETQQYMKATKALLVLIPLLGITYILVLVGVTGGPVAAIYSYIRALLLSTQGLMVALFYCFLNNEVRNTILHHMNMWKETRDIERRLSRKSDHRRSNQYKKHESGINTSAALTMVKCSHRVSNSSVVASLLIDPNIL